MKKNTETKTTLILPGDLSKDPAVRELVKRFDLIRMEDDDFREGKVIEFVPKYQQNPGTYRKK